MSIDDGPLLDLREIFHALILPLLGVPPAEDIAVEESEGFDREFLECVDKPDHVIPSMDILDRITRNEMCLRWMISILEVFLQLI